MGDAPETVTLVRDGNAIAVPADQAASLIHEGWSVESRVGRVAREESELKEERKPSALGALGLGAARGFTLGASDIVAHTLAPRYTQEALEAHPYASLGGELAGSLAIPIPGAEEAGLAKSAAGALGRGAGEGALFGTGGYVSDVALGDKDLSAEGFVSAMGKGAMFGAGGALGARVTEKGLSAARKLLPGFETTPAAVARAEADAESALRGAKDDAGQLSNAATNRLRELREELRVDPGHAAALDAVAARAVSDSEAELAPARVIKMGMPKAEPATPAVEAASGAVAAPADDLMAQLTGTKAALDEGSSLGQLSARRTQQRIEDAINDHAASVHPEAAKIVEAERAARDADGRLDAWLEKHGAGEVSKFERKTAVDEWVAGRRAKTGWVTEVPEGEGTVGLPRGSQKTFRGSELDRALSELQIGSNFERGRTLAEKVVNPTKKADKLAATFDFGGRPATAQDVIDASNAQLADRGMSPLDESIKAAVRKKMGAKFADADVKEAIGVLSHHEATRAQLAEALGPKAPPGSLESAKAYRAADQAHSGRVAEATSRAAGQAQSKAGIVGKVVDGAQHLGEVTEMLGMLGVNIPEARDIPLVGPLLQAFLRAKIGARVLRGAVPGASAAIAGKAAQARQRLQQAVAKSLEVAERGVAAVSPAMPRVGAILGHSLFGHPDDAARPADGTSDADLFRARARELARASQPGIVEQAIARSMSDADPAVTDSIAATARRKLDFLNSKLPRPSTPSGFDLENAWTPDRQRLREFARYMQAADDPMGALERTSGGLPSMETLETLREVYPSLYAEGQRHVMEQLATEGATISYARRVQLGVVWRLPTDRSLEPGFGAWVQQGGRVPQMPQATPMAATLKADVTIGQETANRTDRDRMGP